MFSAKPYNISVIGEGKLTDQDMDYIRSMVPKFTDYRTTNLLDNHRQYYDLPDGGYFVVQDMGGIFKVVATKDPQSKLLKPDGYANPDYIPMLFSGDISTARYLGDAAVSLVISRDTRRRLADYNPQTNLPSRNLQLKRFNIEPNLEIVPELGDIGSASAYASTQYTRQRPTLYSGAMAEVMQIVGGYGKQPEENESTDDLEKKQFKLPEKYAEPIREELDGIRLPGYSGIPPLDGQYQYDYKFSRTNGVTFDAENKPWLIRVSSAGVHAMPLPLVPATTSRHFSEYIDSVGDEEIRRILDRFGGLPSGEGFPSDGHDFEAWRRAGVIIHVCDSADFYQNSAYFDACGWSFNKRGNTAVNTCHTYNNAGHKIGHTYMLSLSLGAAQKGGNLDRVELSGDEAVVIGNYMNQIIPSLNGSDARTLAILYKLRRVETDVLIQRAEQIGFTVQTEIDFWDNYEIDPIATHSGSVSRIYSGHLYHNARPIAQPQIKFPDFVAGGCVSFDFSPMEGTNPPAVNCDTIVFAAYIEDDLKVIKYFVDWRGYTRQVESTYESVMTVGSWEQTVTEGLSSPQGHFYTSDFDFREIYSPVVTHTKILGKDAGYDSVPYFEFYQFFGRTGRLWRNRYYTHKTTTTRSASDSIKLGVCIPMLDRNALILAKRKDVSAVTETESLQLGSVQDPYWYEYWTYDPVFAWVGGLSVMKGQPYPVNGNPVWVEIEHYAPSPSNDFADQGPWIVGLPHDYTWLIHPNKNEWLHSGGGYPPKVKAYTTSKSKGGKSEGEVVYNCQAQPMTAHKEIPDEKYFLMSPDQYVGVFYRDACKVVFGDAEYASISEQNVHGKRANWGYTTFTQNEREHHFIGVINE